MGAAIVLFWDKQGDSNW